MKFDLYTDVALTRELPEHHLHRGDIVKLVDHHVAPDGKEGHSIEVFNAVSDTIVVTAVSTSALRTLREDEVLSACALWSSGLRELIIGEYRVIYRASKDPASVQVLAVRHGARLLESPPEGS